MRNDANSKKSHKNFNFCFYEYTLGSYNTKMEFSFLLLIIIVSATAFYCCFLPCVDIFCRSIAKCMHNRRQAGVPEAEANYEEDSESRCSDTSIIEIPGSQVVIIDENWDSEDGEIRLEDIIINNERNVRVEEEEKQKSDGDNERETSRNIIIPHAKSIRQASERRRERRLNQLRHPYSYDSDDDSVSSDSSQVPTAYPRLQVTPLYSYERRNNNQIHPMEEDQDQEQEQENDENV